MKTVGIDSCPIGWLAISFGSDQTPFRVLKGQEDLRDAFEQFDRIFIDIPVGIPEENYTRVCDDNLREELGSDYHSSVFNPPIRSALYAPTYAEACIQSYSRTNKKVSLQAWNISSKIKQVDQLLQDKEAFRRKVFESHPELLFKILNGWEPIKQKKQTDKGLKHRLNLMKKVQEKAESIYREIKDNFRRKEIREDDIVDAMVLAHFAQLANKGEIKQLPENPPKDTYGLSMAIHYVRTNNSKAD